MINRKDIYRKIKRTSVLCFMTCMLMGVTAYSQKKDTLSLIREFATVSSSYKQMPMYLEMEMKNTADFITGEEDTMSVSGVFYLTQGGSYVRFGEFEQVVNDTMALLVSDTMKRMIIYPDAATVVNQMRKMMGGTLPDSSVKMLSARYTAEKKTDGLGNTVLFLKSRMLIYGTGLPKETIELVYDSKAKLPKQVRTTRKILIVSDDEQYTAWQQDPALAEKLITADGKHFLVKELSTVYDYRKIEYTDVKVPVGVTDRVTRMEDGSYQPVKNYQGYIVTMN